MSGSARGQGWRFAISRRWLGYLAVVIAFAIACGGLSLWQFDRREEKVAENARIVENFDADPVPIAEVLPEPGSWTEDAEWRPVEVTGRYLPQAQLLARARPFNGFPGFEILTPFEGADGRILIVDRGWIPTGQAQDSPDHVPAPPDGQLTVIARLKPGEPEIPGRSAPPGQIATIRLPDFAAMLGADRVYVGAYGLLASESAPAETGQLRPKPQLTEGNHLSYAVQWIVFALIAATALAIAIRNEHRHRNPEDPRVIAARRREEERRARRKPSDADEEDALLDATR